VTRLESFRHLATPLYATAGAVGVLPFIELGLTLQPWTPGDVSWRYGAVGLLTRTLVTPLVGLAVLVATAAVLGHRAALRAALVTSLGGVVLLIGATGLFLLDMLTMRAMVRPEATAAFRAGAAMALIKLLAGIGVLLAYWVGAARLLRSGASARRAPPADEPSPSPAVVFKAR
jgi:hypothetical protein